MIGQSIAHFEITAKIGEGGMGEVYQATDKKLNRQVALKILPQVFAQDKQRMGRFQREAQVLASLNHPNIAAIHGLEEANGTKALVMELVEGEDLSERIARGPIPLDEALPIALQIAEALEDAHEKGIIHRDLKPANIKLTPEGKVKILDFGLAKALEEEKTRAEISNSPTLTLQATQAGILLGTAAYMSPEQAKGRSVDKRSDIWSFGVVLYEMVTGKRPFQGEDLAEILASVVKEDPDLSMVPARVRRLLVHCLEKDPHKRLRDIGDAWKLLKEPPVPTVVASTRPRLNWAPWLLVGVLATMVAVLALLWPPASTGEALSGQFEIDPPSETQFMREYSSTAISPDGRYVVFAAGEDGAAPPLWLRPLDTLTAQPLEGTENAGLPFWSPDSRSIAFYQGGKIRRSDIAGGVPLVLCDTAGLLGAGGSWNREGTILFASTGGLFRVASSGGLPQQVTEVDAKRKESNHGSPQFLPDGNHFLYLIQSSDPNVQGIYVASLDEPKVRIRILDTDRKAIYVPSRDRHPGYLLWMRGETLLAQPFDAEEMNLSGVPEPVVEEVSLGPPTRASFWASDAGLLAYRTGGAIELKRKLVWMSRDGKALEEAREEDGYDAIRLSPDGKRLAVSIRAGVNADIWVLEFGRGVMTRLTFDPAREGDPVWSPDGSQIAYYSDRSGFPQLYLTAAGGGGGEEQLTNDPNVKISNDWSPDGRHLVYSELTVETGWDLWALPLEGERKPLLVLQTPFNEVGAQFSPDGKWIAYRSNSSGRDEVYVRAFPPGLGSPWQVSNQGGAWPRWRADGKELYYLGSNRDTIMAASVRVAGAGIESDTPRELFPIEPPPSEWSWSHDVTSDGQRFLVVQPSEEASNTGPAPLNLITNWQARLNK